MDFKNIYEQQGKNFVAFFLSDLHLRNSNLKDIVVLEKFIDHLKKSNSKATIYFLGDIFDFWFGPASPVKNEVQSLINNLSDYNKKYGQVIFFEGNHDVHLSDYFNKFGFGVVKDHKVIEIMDKKIVLEHGDMFNPNDHKYLFLRRFLRKSWMRILALYIVPSFITAGIGYYFSNVSSKSTKIRSSEKSERIKNTFVEYAEKRLIELNADIFIAGHTHERMNIEKDVKVEGLKTQNIESEVLEIKRTQIINLGSWFDQKTLLGISSDSNQLNFYKV